MTNAERQKRLRDVLAEEMRTGDPTWWWLSFADGDKPKGQQFLGVAVVHALGLGDATMQAHRLGINPGGEVLGIPAPAWVKPPQEYTHRLLTKAEAQSLDEVLLQQRPEGQ